MNSLAQFKRGDGFSLTCTWKENGTPASLVGLTIAAQIRNPQNMKLVAALTVTPAADQTAHLGVFTLTPTIANTSTWPLGEMICDLEVINANGLKRSSDSFIVPVIEDVTK
jgi:hypothetical protein